MSLERTIKTPERKSIPTPELIKQLSELRTRVHAEMEIETGKRMETNPVPTEDEIYMAAFAEWIEPQVRGAVAEMYRKGYGTQSSGFYGRDNSFQALDGYFFIDDETKKKIRALGAEVLNGPELGLPLNDIIMQIRFYPEKADLEAMREKWDAIVMLLPARTEGPRATCSRAEEFREQYAPSYPSLEPVIKEYFTFLRERAKRKS